MKNKTLWIAIAVIVLILVIGYFTNWFGLGKPKSNTPIDVTKRLLQNNELNKQSCPEGYSLYTNTLNGHSICVKLSTGEIKETIKS